MIHVNNTIFSWGEKKCLHGCKSWESLFFSFKNKPVQVTLEKGRRLAKGQEILTRCREQGGPSLFFFFFSSCRQREENTRALTPGDILRVMTDNWTRDGESVRQRASRSGREGERGEREKRVGRGEERERRRAEERRAEQSRKGREEEKEGRRGERRSRERGAERERADPEELLRAAPLCLLQWCMISERSLS